MRKTVSRGQRMVPCHLGNLNAPRVTPAQTYARVTQCWGEFRQEAPTIWKHWPLLLARWQKGHDFFRIWITCKSSINSSGGTENPCRTPLTVKVSIYSSPVHFTPKKTFHFNFFFNFLLKKIYGELLRFFKIKDGHLYMHKLFQTWNNDHAWYAIASHSGSFVMFIRSSFFFT